MKTLLLILVCMAGITSATVAQKIAEAQVPAAVTTAFHAKFPAAKDLKWEAKKDQFKAEFKVGSRAHDAWLDKTGSITKHKEDFPKSELPEAVKKQVATSFKEYQIDDADKIETGGVVLYQLKLKDTKGERKVLFTADGHVKENNVD